MNDIIDQELSQKDILFILACYCYINAHKLGQDALKILDPSFVVIKNQINQNIEAGNNEVNEVDELEKNLIVNIDNTDITELAEK